MQVINTLNWKSFKITDLFEIKRGSGKVSKIGKYPQVTASARNNGVSGKSDTLHGCDQLTISANGAPGACFYHKGKFSANSDVIILINNFKMTNNIGVFLATVISKSFMPKYSFGKKLGNNRLLQESIFLPEKDGKVNWSYIEEFIKEHKKEIGKIKQFITPTKDKITTSTWKKFKFSYLFETNLSKKPLGNCDCWEVTGQTTNNGRKCKSNKYNQENIFTIASVGAYCGTAFWHPYKFWLGNNVQGYKPKFKVTDNIGIFITTVITKTFQPKYSYGKTASIERIKQESIFLPEKDGQPDWDYMEKFMENLIEK